VAAIVGADEQPVLSPERLAPQVALADVVVERQATVFEKTLEPFALVSRVANPVVDRGVLVELGLDVIAPREEPLDAGIGRS
jgi:hypothetical protein